MAIGTHVWFVAPLWQTGNRPSTVTAGMIGFNSSLGEFEGYDGSGWVSFTGGGGGGGDNILVNGASVTDADFNDTTPAAPTAGTIDDINVKWQKSGSSPTSISAYITMDDVATALVTSGSVGTFITINGGAILTAADFNDTAPAAPNSNDTNVKFQESGGAISGYIDGDDLLTAIGDKVDGRFGNGQDGTVTLGSNTTLTQDMNYENLDLAGFTLTTNGFIVYVHNTLTSGSAGGVIENNGPSASTGSGANGAATGTGSLAVAGNGTNGGNNANGTNQAARSNTFTQFYTPDGIAGKGGVGGISGTGRSGGTVAAPTGPAANFGRDMSLLYKGQLFSRAGTQDLFGSQGGSGGGSDSATGGGGGAGGGNLSVAARKITNAANISFQAKGGNGAAGTGANSGGGGGGGGGVVHVLYETKNTSLTTTVAGGNGGAKTGTGVIGGSGNAGVVILQCVRA